MASAAFEEIVEDFEFLDDWEDRYRYVIDMGKAMEDMDTAFKVDANKVHGCASQVWLQFYSEDGTFRFDGDSDAMIVRGLVAVLRTLYNGLPLKLHCTKLSWPSHRLISWQKSIPLPVRQSSLNKCKVSGASR